MSLIMWMLVAIGAAFVAGAALLALGLRGRRVDDHPICRRCGFDLVGRQDLGDTWGESVCSECGTDLKRRRAIRWGFRRRRPAAAAIGAVLLAMAVVGGGGLGWTAATNFDWNTVKPVWLLAQEGRSVDAGVRQAALRELVGRAGAGKVSDAQVRMLVDRALEVQVESPQYWYPSRGRAGDGWSDLVEIALGAGAMSADQVHRMAAGATSYELAMSTRIREEGALPMRVTTRGVYMVESLTNRWWAQSELVELIIGGREVDLGRRGAPGATGLTTNPRGGGGSSPTVSIGAIPVGRHSIRATFALRTLEGDSEEARDRTWRVLAERTQEWSGELEIVEAGVEIVATVDDPDLREAITASIKLLGQSYRDRPRGGQAVSGTIEFMGNLPMPVGFDVYWRSDGQETLVGAVAADPRHGVRMVASYRSDFDTEIFSSERADIVLRPNPVAAESLPAIDEIWSGPEIVLPDITIAGRP